MSTAESFTGSWLHAQVDGDEAAALLQDLVAIRSLPGEEAAIQERVASWLRAQGLPVSIEEVESGRPNVTTILENGDGPTLLINGHVDTASIDPRWDPSRMLGVREGARLIGLGAGDMKAGVVAAMLATRALDRSRDRWRGTIIFSSVIDEEAYSKGAHAVIDSGLRADYCIVTESSWDHPCLGAFGKILIRVDVIGKAAHASWPHLGVNAAVEAARFVAQLDSVSLGEHPLIKPSQSVLTFRSGPEKYESIVVPESAQVLINWHTVPGESDRDVIARLQEVVGRLESPATFTFSIDPPYYPAWETEIGAPIERAFASSYSAEAGRDPDYRYAGYGDMNLFSSEAGIPTVMFGPKGGRFHEAEEWVDLPSVAATIRVLLRFACSLLPSN